MYLYVFAKLLGKHARFDSDSCCPHYYIYVVVGYKKLCICLMLNKILYYIVLYCITAKRMIVGTLVVYSRFSREMPNGFVLKVSYHPCVFDITHLCFRNQRL